MKWTEEGPKAHLDMHQSRNGMSKTYQPMLHVHHGKRACTTGQVDRDLECLSVGRTRTNFRTAGSGMTFVSFVRPRAASASSSRPSSILDTASAMLTSSFFLESSFLCIIECIDTMTRGKCVDLRALCKTQVVLFQGKVLWSDATSRGQEESASYHGT